MSALILMLLFVLILILVLTYSTGRELYVSWGGKYIHARILRLKLMSALIMLFLFILYLYSYLYLYLHTERVGNFMSHGWNTYVHLYYDLYLFQHLSCCFYLYL